MLHGVLGVLGHLPLWLLGPEKSEKGSGHIDLAGDNVEPDHVEDSLEFAESESAVVGTKDRGIWQWFRDNQVIISSILQIGIGMTMLVATGMPEAYQWAGVPLIAAGAIQGLLVTKRDFSVDSTDKRVKNQVNYAEHDGKISSYEKDTAIVNSHA